MTSNWNGFFSLTFIGDFRPSRNGYFRPSLTFFQIFILSVLIVLFFVINFADLLASIIATVGYKTEELPHWLRIASAYGRIPLSVAIVVFAIIGIRHKNKETILNPDNNTYHNHFYLSYLICAKILGYRHCRLKNVPIPMQVKLVTNGVFEKFIIGEGIHDTPKEDKITITQSRDDPFTSTVNLVISDTYKVTISQLPGSVLHFSTFEIDRSSSDHMRYSSEELVKQVISTIRNLPKNVVRINAFMTTNPINTYRIAKEAFATAGRDRVKHLYLFQQESEEPRNFKDKGKKIF